MADLYGLTSSGLPPELVAQLQGLTRQQAIAQALLQQSMQAPEAGAVKGRFQGQVSPLEYIAKMAQGIQARSQLGKVDEGMAGLASQKQQMVSDALTKYQSLRNGSPGTPDLPYTDTTGGAESANQPPIPGNPSQPGSIQSALMYGMTNPMLAGSPIVAQDMKRMEPNWQVKAAFVGGREQKMLVNLNNPSQVMPFGDQAAPHMVPVQVTDERGHPATKFVNPQEAGGQTFSAPVKQQMVNVGNMHVAVDPYKPPVGISNSVTPSDVYHRETQYHVAGLGPDGAPQGDVTDVAKMIADYKMAPLSSFAMARPRGQAIMAEVARINPDWDAQKYVAGQRAYTNFTSGKQGDTVRFINNAMAHLDTVGKIADSLNNGDIQMVNKLANAFAEQTGGVAPSNLDAAKQIVGKEVVKAIVGMGGGVGERNAAEETISKIKSPAQLKGVIETYKQLFGGQLMGLKRQYEQSTMRGDFNKFVSPETQSLEGQQGGNQSLLDQADAILKNGNR